MIDHRSFLVTFAVLLPLACSKADAVALEQDPQDPGVQKELARGESHFIRFVDEGNGEGRLDTAIVSYRGPGGTQVELISAVHIADRGYYQKLEKRFTAYDSLLYEMVKPKGAEPRSNGKSTGLVSWFQRKLKDVLHLEFQLDGIDYLKRNFVHADLDAETFRKLSKDRGENIVALMLSSMARYQKRQREEKRKGKGKNDKSPPSLSMGQLLLAFMSKDSSRVLKHLLAHQLQDVEKMMAGMDEANDGKGSVLLTERNKECVRVLRRQLRKGDKKLGVFYGGAHMPDLEKRLRKLGFKKTTQVWLTAWDIKRKPEDKKDKNGGSKTTSRKTGADRRR